MSYGATVKASAANSNLIFTPFLNKFYVHCDFYMKNIIDLHPPCKLKINNMTQLLIVFPLL